tara:strand:+ start:654 stop:2396 length:1743 start_codon:yes stop_codon:yes gene_type:complete
MSTTVKYDGVTISPAPFVSKTMEAVDYGNRWGAAQNITLRGHVTGTDAIDGTGKIGVLTDIFQKGFKTLTVESDGDTSYYSASNCVLQSLSFDNNKFSSGSNTPVPYSVTLKSHDVPSGVVDISSEYSYKENKDGTVSVTHATSARGVKVSSADPIDNAYNFVALFTGKDPISAAAPFLVPTASQSVLSSIDESVDRVNASYSVTENWKYETGSSNAYVSIASLNIQEDTSQEYINLTLNLDFKGDVVNNNFSVVQDAARDFDVYQKLEDYGIVTGDVFLNDFSLNEKEKSSSVNYTVSFFSGEASQALTGLMVHDVSLVWDEIKNQKNFSINSQFKIKGPEAYRAKKILEKKNTIITGYDNYISYLYHAVKDSELYNQFETVLGDGHELNPNPNSFAIKENNTKQDFSMTASFSDRDFKAKETITLPNDKTYPISIGESNYNVTITPENWIFQIDAAANIEGHFIVQDLQCMTRERISLSAGNTDLGVGISTGSDLIRFDSFTGMSGIMDNILNSISGTNIENKFYLTDNNVNSGESSSSIKKNYILRTGIAKDFSKNKFNGFLSEGYERRQPKHKFGF